VSASDPDAADVFWWHSIDLGDRVTPGWKSPEVLAAEWDQLHLGDLTGRSVLDIGAWDGWFSFQAERRGAGRVVALDHYAWSMDLVRQQAYIAECRASGEAMRPYHQLGDIWRPDDLPGKAGFDIAHAALGSRVEAVVADFLTVDTRALGTFDVVLWLGVLYHMEEPLRALRQVRAVTAELAVIESQACVAPGDPASAWFRFHAGHDLNADPTNWFVPTEAALLHLCEAAGFTTAQTVAGTPPPSGGDYRIVVHAVV
jgi:tRNA (mo5U34)-methyltransferase